MTPVDFERELGASTGNAFAVEPTLHQSAYFRPPNRDRRLRGLYHVGGGTHPGAGIPGVLLGAEVTAGLVARSPGAGRPRLVRRADARRRSCRGARDDARVARTFALACRLLPREVRDDVYLLYLVFRTLDDLVDERRPDAPARVAAVEAWCAGEPRGARARSRVLDDLATRHGLPRDALREFCAGMRDDLDGADRAPRPSSTSTATASPDGRRRDGGAPRHAATGGRARQRGGARAWRCSARTSCATSTRTSRTAACTSRARRSSAAAARSRPAHARPCCATRSRAPTRSTTWAWPASACCARGRRAIAAAAGDVPRDPAPDRARRLRRARRAARSSPRRKLVVAARRCVVASAR